MEFGEAAASTGAELIVMGTHGRSGMNRWMLGSVTERILRESPVPLLTVRAAPRGPIRRILSPIDGTEASRRAFHFAARLGTCFDAEVSAVYVHEEGSAQSPPDLCHLIPAAARERCDIRELVRHGDPADEIVALAAEGAFDLMVIGASSRRFFEGLVMGVYLLWQFSSSPPRRHSHRGPAANNARIRRIVLLAAAPDMTRTLTVSGAVSAVDIGYGMQYPSITVNQKVIKIAPAWYLVEQDFELKTGDQVSAAAAPSTVAGDSYLYAIEIANVASKTTIVLRDAAGIPLWMAANGGRGGNGAKTGTCWLPGPDDDQHRGRHGGEGQYGYRHPDAVLSCQDRRRCAGVHEARPGADAACGRFRTPCR